MSSRRWMVVLLIVLPASAGCMSTDIHTFLMPDGSGKMVFEFDLEPGRMPFFVKDPLRHLESPDFMRSSNMPGMVAWGRPQRTKTAGRDRLVLTAYFQDINKLWFYKRVDGEVSPVLRFAFDAAQQDDTLHLRPDLAEDLHRPIPLPKLDSVGIEMDLSPGVIQGLTPILKPVLRDMMVTIAVTAPGALERADGFRQIQGRTASLVVDRDQFLAALTERAGVIVDEEGILLDDPVLRWGESQITEAQMAEFRESLAEAKTWWDANRPRRANAASG